MHPFPYKDTYLLLCVTSISTVHQSSLTSVQLMPTCWVWHLILQLLFRENSYFLLVSCVFINIFHIVFQEYKYISCKRLEYFMTSKPLPQHFTVLVRAIPVSDGVSVSDAVDKFFREYHSSTYLSHTVVHQTGKLRHLLVRFNSFCYFVLFYYEYYFTDVSRYLYVVSVD
jgi:hypothetical protein